MTTAESELGAAALRRLRESRGWSWTDVARALRDTARDLGMASPGNLPVASIQRSVARWESPTDRTKPGDRYQYLLARIYARTSTGSWALGTGSDFAVLLDALRHRGPSHAIRARAHAAHAEVQARAGNPTAAATALDRAWKTVEQLSPDDPFAAFNADRVSGFEGLCALYSGQAQRADDLLTRSLSSLTGSRDAVQRGIGATDLALARLGLGDATACVAFLHEAVDITAITGGRVPAQRIRRARNHLRPWRTEAFVTELDDHIHDTLIGR